MAEANTPQHPLSVKLHEWAEKGHDLADEFRACAERLQTGYEHLLSVAEDHLSTTSIIDAAREELRVLRNEAAALYSQTIQKV